MSTPSGPLADVPGGTSADPPGRALPARPASVPASLLTGLGAGLVGGPVATVFHGAIWYSPAGWWVPWGLAFGAALLLSVSLWAGTATRRTWAAAGPGLVTYLVAWLFAYGGDGSVIVATNPDVPIGVAGLAWFVVVLAVTLAAVAGTARWLRRSHRAG